MSELKADSIAPDFELLDQNNKKHKLSGYRNRWVLLYFYPKDNTPGCTKEACSIADNFPAFEKLNAKVLGISTDSVASHAKFATKHNLPFTLLADTEQKVVNLYGVREEKSMFGKKYFGTKRTSFLIDPSGKINKRYNTVNPMAHAQEVINDLNQNIGIY